MCQINHPYGDKHNIMNIKRYDSLCKLHSNLYTFYWINWKKNLCKLTHKNHKLIDLCEFWRKNKNKLEKQIKYLKDKN